MFLGLLTERKINIVHQITSIAPAVVISLQGILSSSHHVTFWKPVVAPGFLIHMFYWTGWRYLLGRDVVSRMMLYGYTIEKVAIIATLGYTEIIGTVLCF